MLGANTSVAEIFLCAAAAAPSESAKVPCAPDNAWRTGARQPSVYNMGNRWRLSISYDRHPGGPKQQRRKATSGDSAGFNTTWATRAAAELAAPDFKQWVNCGMHAGQRAGVVAENAARGNRTARQLASRFSPRQQGPGARVLNTVSRVAAMAVALGTTGADITQAALVDQWKHDNVDWWARARGRQQHAVDLERAKIPDDRWDFFLARCRATAVQMCLTRNSVMRVGSLVCVVELYLALVELYFNKMLADSIKKNSLREQYVQVLL